MLNKELRSPEGLRRLDEAYPEAFPDDAQDITVEDRLPLP
jgi:hypothetical protein